MTSPPPGTPLVLRRSAGDRYWILVMVVVMGIALLALAVGTAASASRSVGLAALMGLVTFPIGAMTIMVAGEAVYCWRTRIVIDAGAVRFDLPRRRGYVPAPPLARELPLAAIEAVDTRLEAFRAAGNTVLQRAYSLRLADGSRLLVGADRRLVAPFFAAAAAAIAERIGAPIRDLGMVEGQAGALMFWGQSVPGWDAEALPDELAELRVREESRAWRTVRIVLAAAALLVLLANLL